MLQVTCSKQSFVPVYVLTNLIVLMCFKGRTGDALRVIQKKKMTVQGRDTCLPV